MKLENDQYYSYMAMRTLDLILDGTTSLRRDTATGISPPTRKLIGKEKIMSW